MLAWYVHLIYVGDMKFIDALLIMYAPPTIIIILGTRLVQQLVKNVQGGIIST